jgi:hypothetical protein
MHTLDKAFILVYSADLFPVKLYVSSKRIRLLCTLRLSCPDLPSPRAKSIKLYWKQTANIID